MSEEIQQDNAGALILDVNDVLGTSILLPNIGV